MDYKQRATDALNELYAGETEADIEDRLNDRVRVVIHLKQRMKERNITQMQLAELAGVRQASISQLSRGHIDKLHLPTLEKIAHALDISDITQLLTFDMESEIMSPSNPYDMDFGK
jgi:predicted XRE-type DNA-binding protein